MCINESIRKQEDAILIGCSDTVHLGMPASIQNLAFEVYVFKFHIGWWIQVSSELLIVSDYFIGIKSFLVDISYQGRVSLLLYVYYLELVVIGASTHIPPTWRYFGIEPVKNGIVFIQSLQTIF